MPAALIGRDVVMDWIRKHRPSREFTAGTICTALQAKELNVRSSVSHTLTHLTQEGFLLCTTPGKHRHRSYKMVQMDVAAPPALPAPEAPKPAAAVGALGTLRTVDFKMSHVPLPGVLVRIERKLDRILEAWGLPLE